MVEVFNKNEAIITVEKPSAKPGDYKINANSHKGIILSLLQKLHKDVKHGVNYTPIELKVIFEEALRRYEEIKKETKATVKLKGWKGISGINVIQQPDSFLVITWQKADQESDAKEIQRVITKDELNAVIGAINLCIETKKISTKLIAKQFCVLRNVTTNHEGKNLFEKEVFQWDLFFSDRYLHTQLNLCLRVLDYYQIIKYRGGKSEVLKKVMDIQTEL